MKVQTKNILLATLLFASLISCKSKISEEVIESYKTENSFYEKTLIEKSVSKEDLLQETEDNYKQFISEIDPAKKTAFEKDKVFKSEFESKKLCLIELAEKSQSNILHTNTTVELGNRFIESLSKGEIEKEEEAEKQWEDFRLNFSQLQAQADSIENHITDNKSQLYDMYKNALNIYGLKPIIPSKNRK